ncbi:protein-tyrosine phosphatase [Pseudonocardia sediminis]|uniref:Protein-tyrosine phosphatase n=1 Tax=Pseudonocardia sediminis TaxID=1397368 RepID=A0A4Q7V2Y2_PSEST|nr:low molecular weight phosphatase family protein [Pseudonocardia sediminis]RZT87888.1 protein-tyrosine phosphatase [Pseudonocardia sediminis]
MTIAPQQIGDREIPGRQTFLPPAGAVRPSRPGRHRIPTQRGDDVIAEPFRILFVCTGNICRSPTAELLTRHLLVGRLGGRDAARVQVASAGVRAVVGASVHPGSRAGLAPWGLDGVHSERFAARQLESSVVDGVDLVLGASPRHRSAVLERFPELLGKTFSLREFARLAALVDAESLPADLVQRAQVLVGQARRLRGTVAAPDDDRIPDPIGGTPEEFQRATALTFEALRAVVDAMAPRRPSVTR